MKTYETQKNNNKTQTKKQTASKENKQNKNNN